MRLWISFVILLLFLQIPAVSSQSAAFTGLVNTPSITLADQESTMYTLEDGRNVEVTNVYVEEQCSAVGACDDVVKLSIDGKLSPALSYGVHNILSNKITVGIERVRSGENHESVTFWLSSLPNITSRYFALEKGQTNAFLVDGDSFELTAVMIGVEKDARPLLEINTPVVKFSYKGQLSPAMHNTDDFHFDDGLIVRVHEIMENKVYFQLGHGSPSESTLHERETIAFTIDGRYLEVTPVIIDTTQASVKFSINGVLTDSLRTGDEIEVSGTKIKILSLIKNESSTVTFSVQSAGEESEQPPSTPVAILCVETADCPVAKICMNGVCVENIPCQTNADCTVDQTCVDGICGSVVATVVAKDQPEALPLCAQGCMYDETCLPFGTRINDAYCDLDSTLKPFTSATLSCDNNYECQSNLCIDSECVEQGLFKKIITWFSLWF